jgi:hypothetical protein
VSAPEEKLLLEFNIVAAAKAQALEHLRADKHRPAMPDKPSEKHDQPNKNEAKPKDRTGCRPLPFAGMAQK